MTAANRSSLKVLREFLIGPAAIALLTLVMMGLMRAGVPIPNPGLLCLVLTVVLALTGEWLAIAINTFLALAAAIFLYSTIHPLSLQEEDVSRLLIAVIFFPAAALIVFTLRRRLERALAVPALAEHQLFQAVMAAMHDAIVETDWQGIRDVNESFCKKTGFTREELLGAKPPFPFWPVEQYASIAAALETSMRGQALDFELILNRKNGERFPVLLSVSRILDASEGRNRVLYSFREITELKRAQQELQESKRHLQTAINAARMGAWDMDLRTGVVAWSGYHDQLWGMKPGEFDGTMAQVVSRLHPDDANCFEIAHEAHLKGEVHDHEFRIVWPDNSIHWMASTGAATFNEKGEAIRVSGVVRDVTERHQSQMLLAGQRKVLEKIACGDRLDDTLTALVLTIEEMMPGTLCSLLTVTSDRKHLHIAAAPHFSAEFNSRVEGLALGSEGGSCGAAAEGGQRVVSRDLQTDPLWTPYREMVAAEGLAACTSQPILGGDGAVLGTFGVYYRQPQAPSTHDLRVLDLAASLAAIALERDRKERELRDAKETAEIANRTKDRFLHLLSHELRSPLTPILTLASVLETDARLPEELRTDMVIIRRNAEVEARLVDELLELVRIARRPLSGEAESTIREPREGSRQAGDIPELAPHGGHTRKPLRILIVEDHTDTRLILSRTLRRRGHVVTAAATVAEALAAARANAFDFLLSDIGLPDGSGLDLIQQIHAIQRIPAIALSGFGSQEDARRSLEAGFLLHLVKPINFNTLQEAIERFGAEQRPGG